MNVYECINWSPDEFDGPEDVTNTKAVLYLRNVKYMCVYM